MLSSEKGVSAVRQKNRSFLFDRMLGKLCVKLRMLGVDAKLNPEGESGPLPRQRDEGRENGRHARAEPWGTAPARSP